MLFFLSPLPLRIPENPLPVESETDEKQNNSV